MDIIIPEPTKTDPDEHGLTKLQRLYAEMVAEAESEVGRSNPKLHGLAKDAHVALYMTKDVVARQASLRTIAATVMVATGRDALWRFLPPSDINPEGVKDAKGFLREAGVPNHGTFYELAMIGDVIAPFAEQNGIDLTPLLTQDNCPKFIEAVSYMRRQILEGEEPKQLEATVERIVALENRDSARSEFRDQRERTSKAKVNHVGDMAIVTIVVPDKEDAGTIVNKLKNVAEFNLRAHAVEKNTTIEVIVEL